MHPAARGSWSLRERRKFEGGKLVVASHNPGKLREISDLLAPFDVEPISAGSLGLPEPVEDGDSFIANARPVFILPAGRGREKIFPLRCAKSKTSLKRRAP